MVKKRVDAFSLSLIKQEKVICVEDQINVGLFDESELVYLDVFRYMELDQVTCLRWLCSSKQSK